MFKNIRTAYGRYLKRVKCIPSGSGRDAVPAPTEFANLGWLDRHIHHRSIVGNFESENLHPNISSVEENDRNDEVDVVVDGDACTSFLDEDEKHK